MVESTTPRGHYRIQYPVPERPSLMVANGERFEVVNVSEAGLNLLVSTVTFSVGSRVRGTLMFQSGATTSIDGRVIRRTATRMVMLLDVGVPLPIIMEEQRLLIQKYSTLELAEVIKRDNPEGAES